MDFVSLFLLGLRLTVDVQEFPICTYKATLWKTCKCPALVPSNGGFNTNNMRQYTRNQDHSLRRRGLGLTSNRGQWRLSIVMDLIKITKCINGKTQRSILLQIQKVIITNQEEETVARMGEVGILPTRFCEGGTTNVCVRGGRANLSPVSTEQYGSVPIGMVSILLCFDCPMLLMVPLKCEPYCASFATLYLGYQPELSHTMKRGLDPLQLGDWLAESPLCL